MAEQIGEGDLQRSAAGSLKRLDLDYVDLLLFHWPNSAIPLSISVKALCDAKKLGLTRHIGVANFRPSCSKQQLYWQLTMVSGWQLTNANIIRA
jgi:diketogulonate reductase-like aldo/keto reductase